jgi:DNA-binding transcriptional LysR family regulator
MREVHFKTLDLNLLRVLDALAEERSVTRAGSRLGLTQSAVSHALSRLRYALEDELFVRGPDGMTPTPRAAEILPELRKGLTQLEHAMAPTEFAPAAAERTFNISCSAYIGEMLMPKVMARVRRQAPGVHLNLRPPDGSPAEALESGRLDLAIGVFGRVSDAFAREPLFEERLVWVLRQDHPALSRADVAAALEEAPLAVLATARSERPERTGTPERTRTIEPRVMWDELDGDAAPMGRNARERIRIVVDNAHAALSIIGSTDMAGLAPYRLALSRKEALGLAILDAPSTRQGAVFEAVWRADQTSHPALSWLRAMLREAAAEA